MRLVLMLMAWLAVLAPAQAAPRGPLVLAAASLQESLTEASDKWAAKGHAKPVISFAASSALARQILAGAPADLFVSADEQWMDAVAAKGLIRAGTRAQMLTNQLVLIAPVASKARLTIARGFALAAAIGNGRLAMADPDSVPAGRYGKESLTRLGVWPAIAAKLARAENVRAALALVERGEVPFGIVYATDALASRAVQVIGTFPANSHSPITYPVATLTTATNPDSEGFRRFLLSAGGKAIFARHGFGIK
ncbi:MAG: molybdate transporter substrate-binding protein [Pseudomonadota bacterium]